MVEVDKPQPFMEKDYLRKNRPQPLLMRMIIDWARELPGSEQGIIDLGAGQGIEARALSEAGFKCVGLDVSPFMLENRYHPNFRVGSVELLDYPDGVLSGALVKDLWNMLSSLQRKQMLTELNRTLVLGGSLYVITHNWDGHTAFYEQGEYKTRKKLRSQDFSSSDEWKAEVEKLSRQGAEVYRIHYQTNQQDIEKHAQRRGFDCDIVRTFFEFEPLALENRWIKKGVLFQMDGFIAKLTKI